MKHNTRKMALAVLALAASLVATAPLHAQDDKTHRFSIQTAVPNSSLYFKLMETFAERIDTMSGGRLQAKVLPDGAEVKAFDILDAVSDGTVEAGMAWPHYWSGKNSAFVLFSNPPASSGLDQHSFMAWYERAGGKELHQELLDSEKYNIKVFLIQPMGPDPLGWFNTPIETMDDFRKLKYRAPPGIAGQTYQNMGIAAVALPGGDIVPSAQRGVIDAAEWIGPADDRQLGLHKIWKHYYLQGLHQQTDVGELTINKEFWEGLPADLQAIIASAAKAMASDTLNANIYDNSHALAEYQKDSGIEVHDTPSAYYQEFIAAERKVTEGYANENPFFKKVLDSQKEFANLAFPYWSRILELHSSMVKTAHEEQQK